MRDHTLYVCAVCKCASFVVWRYPREHRYVVACLDCDAEAFVVAEAGQGRQP